MATMAVKLLPTRPWRPPHRWYSVRAPALQTQPSTKDKTLADLKGWTPDIPNPEVQVYGHVRSRKKLGQVSFVNITDGSSMRPLQAVVPRSLTAGYVVLVVPSVPMLRFYSLSPGSAVHMKGVWHVKRDHAEMIKLNGQSASAEETSTVYEQDSLPLTEASMQAVDSAQSDVSSSENISNVDPEAAAQVSRELQVSHVEVLGESDAQVGRRADITLSNADVNCRRTQFKTSTSHLRACAIFLICAPVCLSTRRSCGSVQMLPLS
jgi:asparaginyl-tRNA synthetase